MASRPHGGTADAVIVNPADGEPVPFAPFTAWTQRTGGTQITELYDAGGDAIPGGLAAADLYGVVDVGGPLDGTGGLWIDAGSGTRFFLPPRDLAERVEDLEAGSGGGGIDADNITSGTVAAARLPIGTIGDTVAAGNDSRITGALPKSGGTMTGALTLSGAPSSALHAATKAYVDSVGGGGGGGGGGATLPNTFVVSASGSGVTGDYTCDGTADDVQVQAAVTEIGRNGLILLSAGTFNFAAVVEVLGSDDTDVEGEVYIRGAGPSNTVIMVESGVQAAFLLSDAVRCHISDLGIYVTGASDGIVAAHSATPAAVYRSAWFSSIERVQVSGPWDGSHTGWGLDLGNVFRFRCANVEIGGTRNGIRMINETAEFNAGDSTFDRCFVEVLGDNAIAYSCYSTAGNMNQILFTTCHSIADAGDTGTIAWQIGGPGNTSHIRMINCNIEQFATSLKVDATAYDVDADFVHVTLRNGSVLADIDGYNTRVGCGLGYIEPAAVVTVIDDDNGYAAKPNVYGPIDIYADTGSTANADLGNCGVGRHIVVDGSGATIAAVLRRNPMNTFYRATTLTYAASITIDAYEAGSITRCTLTGNLTLVAPTNPVDGQQMIVQLTASGGTRTVTWPTSTNGFLVPTAGVTLPTSLTVGQVGEVEAVYSLAAQRWRVSRAQIFSS